MPKALPDTNGYRFSFFSSDCDEPVHVHVIKDGNQAKFWIWSLVELARNRGFNQQEIDEIRGIIIASSNGFCR